MRIVKYGVIRKVAEMPEAAAASPKACAAAGEIVASSDCVAAASPLEFDRGKEVTYDDLGLFTDNFSKPNLMGRTQFGMLYRGIIPPGWKGIMNENEKHVTIKMWETTSFGPYRKVLQVTPEYILARMKDEIRFLSLPSLQTNQYVGKVLGYCFEQKKWGVIYDVNPFDTAYNIIRFEDKFSWHSRVKVAIGVARFMSFCHGNTPKYLLRNLSSQHVIVDKDFNPVLVDFAMILGGGIGDDRRPFRSDVPISAYGYYNRSIIMCGGWSTATDVYSFGIFLLELIQRHNTRQAERILQSHDSLADIASSIYSQKLLEARDKLAEEAKNGKKKMKCFFFPIKKKVENREKMIERIIKEKIQVNCLFVNEALRHDPEFDMNDGIELTRLAVSCFDCLRRESMEEIVRDLEKLHVMVTRPIS